MIIYNNQNETSETPSNIMYFYSMCDILAIQYGQFCIKNSARTIQLISY